MKKITIIILAVVVCSLSGSWAYGQRSIRLYTKNLDAYVGTWEYTTVRGDTFRVILTKGFDETVDPRCELLVGGYYYSKNGVIIADYTAPIPNVLSYVKESYPLVWATNAGMIEENVNPNALRVYFNDMVKKKATYSGHLTLLSPTQARWKLEDDEGDYGIEEGEPLPPSGFSVPTDVVMTKIL